MTFAAPTNDTAWFVVRYKGEISAAVLLHCHILAHQNGGMAYTLAQGPEDFPKVPEYYRLRANGEAPHTPLPFGPDDLTIPVLEEGLLQ